LEVKDANIKEVLVPIQPAITVGLTPTLSANSPLTGPAAQIISISRELWQRLADLLHIINFSITNQNAKPTIKNSSEIYAPNRGIGYSHACCVNSDYKT